MTTELRGDSEDAPVLPTAAEPRDKPAFRLHSAENVAIATFFGSPVGGAWLIVWNELNLGNASRARVALGLGFLSTLTLFALVIVASLAFGDQGPPDGLPQFLIPVAYTAAMRAWATRAQGEAYRAHLAVGGLRGSSWVALGIGLVFAGLTVGAGILVGAVAAVLLGGN